MQAQPQSDASAWSRHGLLELQRGPSSFVRPPVAELRPGRR